MNGPIVFMIFNSLNFTSVINFELCFMFILATFTNRSYVHFAFFSDQSNANEIT